MFDTGEEVDEFLVFVTEQRHANLASVMSYCALSWIPMWRRCVSVVGQLGCVPRAWCGRSCAGRFSRAPVVGRVVGGECAGQRGGGVALDDDHGGRVGSQAPVQCRDHVTELCSASLVAVASGCEVLELDAEGGGWMTRVSGLSRLMIGASLISSARVPARRPVVPGCRVGIVR